MTATKLTGAFAHVIHSPHGGVEGLLLDVGDGVTQVVLDKDDEKNAALISTLKSGQQLVLSTDDIPPSRKGPGAHPVRALRKLISVRGHMGEPQGGEVISEHRFRALVDDRL